MQVKRKITLIVVAMMMFYNCSDIVRVEDISNEAVTILAPVNESTLSTPNVLFSWEPIEEAENYRIQIATPTFTEALQIVTDSTLATSSFSKTLDLGSYEWRVKALNSAYETDYTTQGFTIEE